MTLQVQNIMKVADISESQISPETVQWIEAQRITYTDNDELKEHLYDFSLIMERIEFEEIEKPINEKTMADLAAISNLLAQNDCAYLRITKC